MLNDNVNGQAMENDIVDISLSPVRKKRFRIDEDDNRIIELNTSDMSIVTRLGEKYGGLDDLQRLADEIASQPDDGDDSFEVVGQKLKEIDSTMREYIDYIFDEEVSAIVAPSGTMFDPFNGKFRYEYIIDVLSGLYEDNITKEAKKMTRHVRKHTDKYKK